MNIEKPKPPGENIMESRVQRENTSFEDCVRGSLLQLAYEPYKLLVHPTKCEAERAATSK